MIYLDNSASSLHKPQMVKQAVVNALNKYTANPGRSGHKLAQAVAEKVFDAREAVLKFFNANNHQVIFTKNCTEALNLAILGSLTAGDHVITTMYEHNSVLRPLTFLQQHGVEITYLNCPLSKLAEELETAIKPYTKLIITNAISNVNGEVCELDKVSYIRKAHNIKWLIDGAQASGHIDINLEKLGADMYAFAGHKGLKSITGVGGLVVKNGVELKPILFGGTGTESANLKQPADIPEGLEAGTIPTISIISLKAGINFLQQNWQQIKAKEKALNNYIYNKLSALKFIHLYSPKNAKNVFAFNIDDFDSTLVADILNNKFDICVRSGLHCAPLVHKRLGTINQGAVRVSLDYFNSFEEIDRLIFALEKIHDMQR